MPRWLTGSQLQAKEKALYSSIMSWFKSNQGSDICQQQACDFLESKGVLIPNYYRFIKKIERFFESGVIHNIDEEIKEEKSHLEQVARDEIKGVIKLYPVPQDQGLSEDESEILNTLQDNIKSIVDNCPWSEVEKQLRQKFNKTLQALKKDSTQNQDKESIKYCLEIRDALSEKLYWHNLQRQKLDYFQKNFGSQHLNNNDCSLLEERAHEVLENLPVSVDPHNPQYQQFKKVLNERFYFNIICMNRFLLRKSKVEGEAIQAHSLQSIRFNHDERSTYNHLNRYDFNQKNKRIQQINKTILHDRYTQMSALSKMRETIRTLRDQVDLHGDGADYKVLTPQQARYCSYHLDISDINELCLDLKEKLEEEKVDNGTVDELERRARQFESNYYEFAYGYYQAMSSIENGVITYWGLVQDVFKTYIDNLRQGKDEWPGLPGEMMWGDPIPDGYNKDLLSKVHQILQKIVSCLWKYGQFYVTSEQDNTQKRLLKPAESEHDAKEVAKKIRKSIMAYLMGKRKDHEEDHEVGLLAFFKGKMGESFSKHFDELNGKTPEGCLQELPEQYIEHVPLSKIGELNTFRKTNLQKFRQWNKQYQQAQDALEVNTRIRHSYLQFIDQLTEGDLKRTSLEVPYKAISDSLNLWRISQPRGSLMLFEPPIARGLPVQIAQASIDLVGQQFVFSSVAQLNYTSQLRKAISNKNSGSGQGPNSQIEDMLPQSDLNDLLPKELSCLTSYSQQSDIQGFEWQQDFVDQLPRQRNRQTSQTITQQECAQIFFVANIKELMSRLDDCHGLTNQFSETTDSIKTKYEYLLEDLGDNERPIPVDLYGIVKYAYTILHQQEGYQSLKSLVGNTASMLLKTVDCHDLNQRQHDDLIAASKLSYRNLALVARPTEQMGAEEKERFINLFRKQSTKSLYQRGPVPSPATWQTLWRAYLGLIYQQLQTCFRSYPKSTQKQTLHRLFPQLLKDSNVKGQACEPKSFDCWLTQFDTLDKVEVNISSILKAHYLRSGPFRSDSKRRYDDLKCAFQKLGFKIDYCTGRDIAFELTGTIAKDQTVNISDFFDVNANNKQASFNKLAELKLAADRIKLEGNQTVSSEQRQTIAARFLKQCSDLSDIFLRDLIDPLKETLKQESNDPSYVVTQQMPHNDARAVAEGVEERTCCSSTIEEGDNAQDDKVDLRDYLPDGQSSRPSPIKISRTIWDEVKQWTFDDDTIASHARQALDSCNNSQVSIDQVVDRLNCKLNAHWQDLRVSFLINNRILWDGEDENQAIEDLKQRWQDRYHQQCVEDWVHASRNELVSENSDTCAPKRIISSGEQTCKSYDEDEALTDAKQKGDYLTASLIQGRKLYRENVVDRAQPKSGCLGWLKRCLGLGKRASYENIKDVTQVAGLRDLTQILFGQQGNRWDNNSARSLILKSLRSYVQGRPDYYKKTNAAEGEGDSQSPEDPYQALYEAPIDYSPDDSEDKQDHPECILIDYLKSYLQPHSGNYYLQCQFIEEIGGKVVKHFLGEANKGQSKKDPGKISKDTKTASSMLGVLESMVKAHQNKNQKFELNADFIRHFFDQLSSSEPCQPCQNNKIFIQRFTKHLKRGKSWLGWGKGNHFLKDVNTTLNESDDDSNELAKLMNNS